MKAPHTSAFTIVELLIVIVVIGILATITIVAYNGVSNSAKASVLQSDLKNAVTKLQLIKAESGSYPTSHSSLEASPDTSFSYVGTKDTFCLEATNPTLPNKVFSTTPAATVQEGNCNPSLTFIQTITKANCPAARTMVIDARDGKTYWIQRITGSGYDECWMLTNLAYAGGGNDAYSDTVNVDDGTDDTTYSYVAPKYYIPTGSNATTYPAEPSVSTSGNGQYGYLYNWCATMGAQLLTGACGNYSSPAPDTDITICPSGWRLPAGGESEDFKLLNDAVNGGSTSSDAGLRTNWLAQRGGLWFSAYVYQATYGNYWSGTQHSASNGKNVRIGIAGLVFSNYYKGGAFAVRCLAV